MPTYKRSELFLRIPHNVESQRGQQRSQWLEQLMLTQ